ncbi:MAG: hypothetical protein CMF36_15750, partial [Leeuwenhoekiella sp.]|nr:hypothetical protein [Leeuwenhoekiella sp.]
SDAELTKRFSPKWRKIPKRGCLFFWFVFFGQAKKMNRIIYRTLKYTNRQRRFKIPINRKKQFFHLTLQVRTGQATI